MGRINLQRQREDQTENSGENVKIIQNFTFAAQGRDGGRVDLTKVGHRRNSLEKSLDQFEVNRVRITGFEKTDEVTLT